MTEINNIYNEQVINSIKQRITRNYYILNEDELIELQLFLAECFMNKDKNTIIYIKNYLIYVNYIIYEAYEKDNKIKPAKVEKYCKFITGLIDDIQYYLFNLNWMFNYYQFF